MLNHSLTLNREFFSAEPTSQKLFAMLKLRPNKDVTATPPPVNFVCLIDTSGSMYEVILGSPQPTGRSYQIDGHEYAEVKGGTTKIDIVIESLKKLIHSGKLKSQDRLSIIQFDDNASTLIDLTPPDRIVQLESAIEQLRNYSGGTRLGLGMRQVLDLLVHQSMSTRRVLLFTDGQTCDEDICQEIAQEFSQNNIPISALGVGDYAEDLMIYLSDTTAGNLYHVVPQQTTTGTEVSITNLPNQILEEFAEAQQEVITNLALTVKTVEGVKLTQIDRVYPSLAQFPLNTNPHRMGNLMANDETVFILEFEIEQRAPSRVRIAQLGLTYDIPGQNRRGELPPQNLIVQFVSGPIGVPFDKNVMHYVQQRNVAGLVEKSIEIVDSNPEESQKLLETARQITQKSGNSTLSDSLGKAQEELRKTRKISPEHRKTVKIGSKGKTVRMGGDINDELSEDLIRQVTGT